jgi:hypothetical protein
MSSLRIWSNGRRRLLKALLIAAGLALASTSAGAQSRIQLDTVKNTPALTAAMEAGEAAYCAPLGQWRRYPDVYNVYFDSLRTADKYMGVVADCDPREATVLVRPYFGFQLLEFLLMRPRAHYVALISPPYGVGMPLGRFPAVQSTPADGTSVRP